MSGAGIQRLKRTYTRLKSMDRDEVSYRFRDFLRTHAERVGRWQTGATNQAIPWRPGKCFPNLHAYVSEHCSPRFYLPASPEERAELRQIFNVHFPQWKGQAIAEAQRLLEHRISLLGHRDVFLGKEICWHRDPITGALWPQRFWADYELTADHLPSDPKNIHELGRCQHLPRLAKAHFITGDERYAEEALGQILSWIDQNPPGMGIHWNSSLEIGLRVISWLWTLFFVLEARCVDEDALRRVLSSVAVQLQHVYDHLSVYSSPNTHLLGEATALYIGGMLFQEWEPASPWRQTAEDILAGEAEKQFTKDGFHGELSSYYHCYALDFYLQAASLSTHNNSRWPSSWWQRVEQMVDVVMCLARPNGLIPRLGDEDGGRALALQSTSYTHSQDSLCTAAALFGRPQFKYCAKEFREETLWMLGSKAWWIFSTMESKAPRDLQTLYESSGLAIQRSDWSDTARHMIFDFGGMGMFRGGHGHADALSITLSAGDSELLIDPGTYIYNGAREWRDFLRSSGAHNTANVDGCEQSEPAETFSWKSIATSRMTRKVNLPGASMVEAEHDGFLRLPQPITHRRSVLYCRPDHWLIVDRFAGQGTHDFDLYYRVPGDARIDLCREKASQCGKAEYVFRASVGASGLEMFLAADIPVRGEVISGQLGNIQGWASDQYGRKEPAPTLRLTGRGTAPCTVASLLITASEAPKCLRRVSLRQGDGIALEAQTGIYHDVWLIAQDDSDCECLGYRMRGELFWVRTYHSGVRQLIAFNASYFDFEGAHPSCRLETFQPSVRLVWNREGERIELAETEDMICVESVES